MIRIAFRSRMICRPSFLTRAAVRLMLLRVSSIVIRNQLGKCIFESWVWLFGSSYNVFEFIGCSKMDDKAPINQSDAVAIFCFIHEMRGH